MAPEQWAEKVRAELVRASDRAGIVITFAFDAVTIIAATIRQAVAAERERVLSTDRARFHANALLAGTWEYEALEAAKETEREACAEACAGMTCGRPEVVQPHPYAKRFADAIRARGPS